MTDAFICTIGDELLIGQVVDTNSARIAQALGQAGVTISGRSAVGDDSKAIENAITSALKAHSIVITTGGLGPTKDDITKAVLARISHSNRYVEHQGQWERVQQILHGRGLDILPENRAQALAPENMEVIVNQLGTAPIMIYRSPEGSTLYALPGVPHEAVGALPSIIEDIRAHYPLQSILHRNIMVYGLAESALSKLIEPWETALDADMHLAYLPNPLTGVRLRLSMYNLDSEADARSRMEEKIASLKEILGEKVYADEDSTLEESVGKVLKKAGKTLSAAESCTGGEIAHLITSVPGASEWFLGSVTSYAVSVKEGVLGVPHSIIEDHGVVSSEVAIAMAQGVRRLTGSDFAVATTGLAGPSGDGVNPVGTVWIGVAGPGGNESVSYVYKNDRARNIERFSASALNFLRLFILKELSH